tara:strand:- start:1901 stop:2167 length:267 start_codon:yes stop_codon:yes gene_type:complete
MKKIEPLPFHTLYDKNDNMYQNVIIVSKRARGIISENALDLQKLEEGFESTEEIQEKKIENPNKPKAIVTATNEFVSDAFEWNKNIEE